MIWPVFVAYSLGVVVPASVSVRRRKAPFSRVWAAAAVEFAWLGIVPPNSACASALAHSRAATIAGTAKAGKKEEFGMATCLAIGKPGALKLYQDGQFTIALRFPDRCQEGLAALQPISKIACGGDGKCLLKQ